MATPRTAHTHGHDLTPSRNRGAPAADTSAPSKTGGSHGMRPQSGMFYHSLSKQLGFGLVSSVALSQRWSSVLPSYVRNLRLLWAEPTGGGHVLHLEVNADIGEIAVQSQDPLGLLG